MSPCGWRSRWWGIFRLLKTALNSMGFKADVFNVMIASPSDVAAERKAVREIIYEWNVRHADELKKVLLPVGWETHSTPDMGGSPQSVINKQILFGCDLLIGIFWTRIGTPTAEYASGAVEEIERHIAAGKPTMLYFSEKPIKPGVFDTSQYNELIKFQKSCQPRGLYKGFKSVADFKKQFENNLTLKLRDEYFKSNVESKSMPSNGLNQDLSSDAIELLKLASQDKRGVIHQVSVLGGTYIQTNNINVISTQSAREIARWKSALQVLLKNRLVKAIGSKGEGFEVTTEGFTAADSLVN